MRNRNKRHRICAALVVLWLVSGSVAGAPFKAKDSGHQVAVEGNSRGATGCVACHGEDGRGMGELGYPRLAGMPQSYLLAQLRAFRLGTRQSSVMERIAKALNEQEMEMVVAYYARLEVPDTSRPLQDAAAGQLGKRLVTVGKWDQGTPACVRCHGHDAQGVAPAFPRLAGQHASYLKKELHRWQDGQRHNDPVGLMQAVAESLDDAEIDAVANYLASIAPAVAQAAGAERGMRAPPVQDKEGVAEELITDILPDRKSVV